MVKSADGHSPIMRLARVEVPDLRGAGSCACDYVPISALSFICDGALDSNVSMWPVTIIAGIMVLHNARAANGISKLANGQS
jgi:hypothetical protein